MSDDSDEVSLEPLKRRLLDEMREALREDDVREVRTVAEDLVTAAELYARHENAEVPLASRGSARGADGTRARRLRERMGRWEEKVLQTAKHAVAEFVEEGGSFRRGDLLKRTSTRVTVDRSEEEVESLVSTFLDALLERGVVAKRSSGWIRAESSANVAEALSDVVDEVLEQRRAESSTD